MLAKGSEASKDATSQGEAESAIKLLGRAMNVALDKQQINLALKNMHPAVETLCAE